MQLNSFAGKQLLALIRDSDYAHAGEEEAIELALRSVPRRPGQLLLDVGCGRGGTAKYVQDHGWGSVVGLDVEPDSIARARQVYPGIEFHACDVVQASSALGRKPEAIYLFNSFYAFADQPRALAGLAKLAKPSGQLILFDYTDRGGYDTNPLLCDGEPFIPHPVRLSAIGNALRRAGWELTEVEDLTAAYDRWYDSLVQRMDGKRAQAVAVAGTEGFNFVRNMYVGLLGAIRGGSLGGAIVRARRSDADALS
jgi:cyclopropane fatty-acyl-phospholipid synthase-like methyltransferase